MHNFHTEHDLRDNKYKTCENISRKSTIKNHKKLKINLMKIIESSMKGMIKEHKKTGNKKIDWRKEKKIILFFYPVKHPVYFLCSTEKKLTRDRKSGKNDVTQVTA